MSDETTGDVRVGLERLVGPARSEWMPVRIGQRPDCCDRGASSKCCAGGCQQDVEEEQAREAWVAFDACHKPINEFVGKVMVRADALAPNSNFMLKGFDRATARMYLQALLIELIQAGVVLPKSAPKPPEAAPAASAGPSAAVEGQVGFRCRKPPSEEWVTVLGRAPDSFELRECEIEPIPDQNAKETQ